MLLDVSMQLIPELLQRYQLQSTARILNQRAEHLSSTYHTKAGCQPLSSNNYVRLKLLLGIRFFPVPFCNSGETKCLTSCRTNVRIIVAPKLIGFRCRCVQEQGIKRYVTSYVNRDLHFQWKFDPVWRKTWCTGR